MCRDLEEHNFFLPCASLGKSLSLLHGHDRSSPPELGVEGVCSHCQFCCVVKEPPSFPQGSSASFTRNRQHRFSYMEGFLTLNDVVHVQHITFAM